MNPTLTAGPQPAAQGKAAPRGSRWVRVILLAVVLLYTGLLIIAPLVSLVKGAFESGLGAMVTALLEPDSLKAMQLTMLISVLIAFVQAVMGTICALVIVRHKFPGSGLLNALINTPFAVSPVVVGYSLLLMFGRNSVLAPLLERLNIRVAFALPGVFLATLFVCLPFMIRELVPVIEAFGTKSEQAAATLGATGWQTFWRVTFPGIRMGFIYGLSLTFARALGEFGAVLVIGGGIQGRTETTTLYIFRLLDERAYVGAYASALVLGLFSMLLVLGSDWLRRRSEG